MLKTNLTRLAVVGALVFSLTACTQPTARDGVKTHNAGPKATNFTDGVGHRDMVQNHAKTRNFSGDAGMHNNTRLERSQAIADEIVRMHGVRTANVLLTDRNAYIGVVLSETLGNKGSTVKGAQPTGMKSRMGYSLKTRDAALQGTAANPGSRANGVIPNTGSNGMLPNTGATGVLPNTRTQFNGVTPNSGSSTSRTAPNHRGHMDINADVTATMKQEIADLVKRTNSDIVNVYVSANTDFVTSMNNYGEQIRAGKPFSGLINEFNAMVEGIFPTKAGTVR